MPTVCTMTDATTIVIDPTVTVTDPTTTDLRGERAERGVDGLE